jgi:hypothetical protein
VIRRDYPDRPIVGVLAVVLRAGRVLLVQRVRGSFIEHHWTLVPVVCAWESGEVRASDEVVAWRWLAPDEMPGAGIDLLPDVERLARLALTA